MVAAACSGPDAMCEGHGHVCYGGIVFRFECLHYMFLYMFLAVTTLIVEVGGLIPSKPRVSVRLRSAYICAVRWARRAVGRHVALYQNAASDCQSNVIAMWKYYKSKIRTASHFLLPLFVAK